MTTTYATTDDLIARNPSLANHDVAELLAVLEAASRAIDGYCFRRFWLDDSATDRVFHTCDFYELDLGQHEIGTTGNVTVKTDDGTGAYATTIATTGYVLEPVNAPYEAIGAAPYTMLRRLSGTWPLVYTRGERQDRVKVTARYGWPSVPAPVREVCLSLAIQLVENPTSVRAEAIDGYSVSYARDFLEGVSGSGLRAKLSPYRRRWAV